MAGWFLRPDPYVAEDSAAAKTIAKLQADIKSRDAEMDRLTVTVRKDEADKKARAEARERFSPENPEMKKRQDRMKQRMADKQKLKLDEKVAALRTRLKLTDSQAAAIRELLEKNPDDAQSLIAKAMSGEKVDEKSAMLDILKPGKKNAELANQIAALLTPEQRQDYIAFRQEQRSNDVEVKANKELARLQSSLTLSPDQKDKAFATLTKIADEEYDNPVNNMAALMQQGMKMQGNKKDPDMEAHMEEIKAATDYAAERRKMRVEAMREVLTPEQLAIYETQQKQPNVADMMEGIGDIGAGLWMEGDDEAQPAAGGGAGDKPPPPPRRTR